MSDKQPKPPARSGQEKRTAQQVPVPKLMLVFRLDGVSAEPLLMYREAPAAENSSWSKTSFYASRQEGEQTSSSAERRHQAYVSLAVRGFAPHLSRQEEIVARMPHLPGIAREQRQVSEQAQRNMTQHSVPARAQESEQAYER